MLEVVKKIIIYFLMGRKYILSNIFSNWKLMEIILGLKVEGEFKSKL